MDWGLIYTKNSGNHFVDYSDSDYTGDITTHWNIAEYIFYFARGSIIYRLSFFKIVALLITESEYMMLCMAVQKIMWIRGFLNYINHTELKTITIYKDNWSIIDLMKNSKMHNHSKHIDVHFHWLCQIIDEDIKITWIKSSNQTADGLTKALPVVVYQKFIEMLYMTHKIRSELNHQD